MRSGPAAATTRWRSRRRRSHKGGPSGTPAMASTGSGWAQQAQRPRLAGEPGAGLQRHSGRGQRLRALGQMAVDRLQADDARGPQPLGQLIDQSVELGGVDVGGEVGLGGAQRCGLQGLEQHELDAEADVDAVQLEGQEAEQVRWLAHRPAGADGEAGDLAVDPVQPERQAPHAQLPALQLAAQGGEQPQGGGGDVLGAADGLGPADPGRERARLLQGHELLLALAQEPVETGRQGGAEAGEQGRAGQGGELADPAQAQPPQGGEQVRIQPQGGRRQILQGFPGLGRQQAARRRTGPRPRPRRAGRPRPAGGSGPAAPGGGRDRP